MDAIFAAMTTTSTVTIFLLTHTNAFTWSHMTFSEERVCMAILMGSAMPVMFGFMRGMTDKNVKVNVAVIVAAVVVGGSALWLSESQAFVQDEAHMKGRIPHQSIALLTAKGSEIDDMRVRKSADEIIEAQRVEIAEMKWLIKDIENNGCRHQRRRGNSVPSRTSGRAPEHGASPTARQVASQR
jgi:hypothetical protein